MGFTTKTRKILTLLLCVAAFSSCVKEHPVDGLTTGDDVSAKVTLAVRVPGNSNPATRALGQTQEDEVTEILVLAFTKGGGDNVLRHVGKSSGTPTSPDNTNPRLKRFTVDFYAGVWDLMVIANPSKVFSQSGLETKYADLYNNLTVASGIKKSDLQTILTLTESGEWNVDATDAGKGYLMPMWGMKNEVAVETSSTNIVQTVNLYRMISKIGVRVQRVADVDNPAKYPGISTTKFELTHVSLHNYNTTGRLIPGLTAADGNWTDSGGGVALKTSLPSAPNSVSGYDNRMEWGVTDLTEANTALEGVIYTFEADKGNSSSNRPCLIIGGRYDSSSEVTYYRADFLDASQEHLDILRNHKYQMLIRKISGKGFSTIEEAYTAGPTNLEAETIPWDEGEYLEGVWNGNNYIKFSTLEARFTQFADVTHTVTVKSDMGDLEFNNFRNTINAGTNDQPWAESSPGIWSNNHFTVVVSGATQQGSEYTYTLTITGKATSGAVADHPARHCYFNIVGSNLKATFDIYQDAHLEFRLETVPAHQGIISCDGARQRVAIQVNSTHDYAIALSSSDGTMFESVYEDEAMAKQINSLANISNTIKTVYVDVQKTDGISLRVGTVTFTHEASANSDAGASIVTIIQMTPMITATITGGANEAEIARTGGSVTIDVQSNMNAWVPVLTRTVGTTGVSEDLPVGTYFTPASGSANQTVTFELKALPDTELDDHVYDIYFQDPSGTTKSSPAIKITQKAKPLGAGGGGKWPTDGTLAPPNILGVVEGTGELTLDGHKSMGGTRTENVWIVYFRWGSTIAISFTEEKDTYDPTDIAWVPEGYTTDLATLTKWEHIPHISYSLDAIYLKDNAINYKKADPEFGIGDPCRLAVKGKDVGNYRMPIGTTYPQAPTVSGTVLSYKGHWYDYEGDDEQFYPLCGVRNDNGRMYYNGIRGRYWSATRYSNTDGSMLYLSVDQVSSVLSVPRTYGCSIRCVLADDE